MTTTRSSSVPELRPWSLALALGASLLAGGGHALAADLVRTDFSKGTFKALGWEVNGDWTIED